MTRGRPRLPVSTHESKGSPRKGKYNANGRKVDDHWFASDAEAVRYEQLKDMLEAGTIERLELQPSYPITIKGKHITTYRGDFRYAILNELGTIQAVILEDVKGMVTDVYALKKKMVEADYNIKINEIPASKILQWVNKLPV